MPKEYEAIRDKLAQGAPVDSPKYNQAQSEAAAIYNSRHKGNPVTSRPDMAAAARKGIRRR